MHSDTRQYPRAHRQPRLNFDILHLVCNRLADVSDVLSFALTCSTLTKHALRRRLRMSPVNLWNGELVNNFHRFIFADEAARAPCIYGIGLPDLLDISFIEEDRLVTILQAAVHLEYLHFPTAVDFDPLLAAAANITSLHELHIGFDRCFGPPWELLSIFRSPLRSLRIDKGDPADAGVSVKLLHNHLANFAPTLEVLELQDLDLDISPSFVTTQFTTVRSLITHTISDFNQVTVEMLLRLFPNLDNILILDTSNRINTDDPDTNLREWSKEAQKAHTWPGLDRVVCDARWAFLMALRCPIRRMDITVPQFHGKRYLGPTLRYNCPRLLHLRSSFTDGLGDLDDLFPSEGADNLTHLVLFADFEIRYGQHERYEPIPWDRFRDKLISAVKHLHLTHLRLVFHYTVHRARQEAFIERRLRLADTCAAREADLLPTATRFINAIPTLQYVLLTTCGHTYQLPSPNTWESDQQRTLNKWLSSMAWRPVDSYDGHHRSNAKSHSGVVLLSRETAERIVEEEELYLSHDEDVMVRKCGDSTLRRD